MRLYAVEDYEQSKGGGQPEAVAIVVADPQMLDELTYLSFDAMPVLHSFVMAATDAYMMLNYRLLLLILPPAPLTMHLFIGDLFLNGDLWPTARCTRPSPLVSPPSPRVTHSSALLDKYHQFQNTSADVFS